jgi:hypothetical protein
MGFERFPKVSFGAVPTRGKELGIRVAGEGRGQKTDER